MFKLTTDEIDLLQNGLDALESKESNDFFRHSLMSTMLESIVENKDDPERTALLEKKQREREARFEEIERSSKILKEKIVLIKAKLIHMKDNAMVEALTAPKE